METEKRLIDADALETAIQGTVSQVALDAPYDPEWFTRLAARQFEILKIIHDAPTVDAVEVVHGEWVVCGDGEYVPFICSACGKTTSWYHAQTANYCPNCGAKMDGDGNG